VWDISHAHVGSTNGKKLACLDTFAALDNVAGDQGTLGETDDINFWSILEFVDGEEVFASKFALFLEILEDRCK
jgi:hypothetical protein